MFKARCFVVLAIAFSIFSTNAVAEDELQLMGVSQVEEWNKPIFLAAYYTTPFTDKSELFSADRPIRMEVKLLVKSLSSRRNSKHWLELISINNTRDKRTQLSKAIVQFKQQLKLVELKADDKLTFDYKPGTGTRIFQNDLLIGMVKDTRFQSLLTGAWFGPRPLSKKFAKAIQNAPVPEMQQKYLAIVPSAKRIAQVNFEISTRNKDKQAEKTAAEREKQLAEAKEAEKLKQQAEAKAAEKLKQQAEQKRLAQAKEAAKKQQLAKAAAQKGQQAKKLAANKQKMSSAKLAAASFKPYTTFEAFSAEYGNITTVAGRGRVRTKGLMNWKAEYEGIAAKQAEFSRPEHATIDYKGNFYIADSDAHSVRKVTPDGKIFTIVGNNKPGNAGDEAAPASNKGLNYPSAVFAAPSGNLYILDANNSKVRKLDPAGIMTTIVTDEDYQDPGHALWVSDDEKLIYFSSKTTLKKWTPENGIEEVFSGLGDSGTMDIHPEKGLFIADRNVGMVFKINLSTGFRKIMAGNMAEGSSGSKATQTYLQEARSVAFHPNGGFFVATHDGGQVWWVSPKGDIHLFVDGSKDKNHYGDGKPFNAPGEKISEARAVFLDQDNNLFILEHDAGFIRKVEVKSR